MDWLVFLIFISYFMSFIYNGAIAFITTKETENATEAKSATWAMIWYILNVFGLFVLLNYTVLGMKGH